MEDAEARSLIVAQDNYKNSALSAVEHREAAGLLKMGTWK